MAHIIILGAGLGGMSAAYEIRRTVGEAAAPMASVSQCVPDRMPRRLGRPTRTFSTIQALWWSARCRAPVVLAQPTNSQ